MLVAYFYCAFFRLATAIKLNKRERSRNSPFNKHSKKRVRFFRIIAGVFQIGSYRIKRFGNSHIVLAEIVQSL